MTEYSCFRCGFVHEIEGDPTEVYSRDCPSCHEKHTCFTFQEMGDVINNIFVAGADMSILMEVDE